MSEYQYYEFQAIDRPLTKGEQDMLRGLSSRARITATSFTNSYEWGSFKGDPKRLMESCFDLHLYLANWGARQLMIRVPAQLVDRDRLPDFLNKVDWVKTRLSGKHLILDICRDEQEPDYDAEWDDGSGWLASLAPLRADLVSGDLRMLYLLWLAAVEDGAFPDDVREPLPGIGPLTGALKSFATFFGIDADLVQAAADVPASGTELSSKSLRSFLEPLPQQEKTELLARFVEDDPHVAAELRTRARKQNAIPETRRTIGVLKAKAEWFRRTREIGEAAKRDKEERRMAEEREKARRVRLDAVRQRGKYVWKEVESQIELRNASGYDRAASLLGDLKEVASEQGKLDDFGRRLQDIRTRHTRKGQFITRVKGL